MASKPGRISKRKTDVETPSLFKFFKRSEEDVPKTIVERILTEIINLSVDSCEISTKKHGGDSVSVKTVDGWKSRFPWLQIIGEGKNKLLKCRICEQKKVRIIWAEEGSSNFQINSIKRHSESKEHQHAEYELSKSSCSSNVQLSDSGEEDDSSVSLTDRNLFRTVFYAANSETPSSQINSLIQLQKLNGATIDYQNLSWDTITDIQMCICNIFQKELIHDIKDCDFFAIMIDESTDIAIHKHLSVCVRYVKDGEPVTKFLANVELDDGKAHTIVSKLQKSLTKLGLDMRKVVSLATDGASTMMGKKTGVGVQVKSKFSPFVTQTHCIAHRLNLAVTDSIKKEITLEKFKEKFSALYHFMSGSSNRTVKLTKIQTMLQEPNLTIKEPHSIRWLGLKNAVEAVYESYGSVIGTLSFFAAEKNATASGLLKYFLHYNTALLVAFMLDVHEVLAFLSKEFQKESIAFSEINPLIEAVMGKLDFLESKDGAALSGMRHSIEIRNEDGSQSAYLNGEKLSKYSQDSESTLLSLRKKYITSLKKNIKHRFRQEDGDVFKHFSVLLEPSILSSTDEAEHEEALKSICSLYGEDKVVKTVVGDSIENYREEQTVVCKLINKEKLVQEWPMVKGMILGSYSKKHTVSLCKRVILFHQNVVPEFAKLCKIALCLSVSSVACERSFSTQNRLKSKYRSSLKAENLDALIQIQMSGKDMTNYDPTKAIKQWLTIKRRRKARLTQAYKPRLKTCEKSPLPCSSKALD